MTNQASYLKGATWRRKAYRVWSKEWEHDDCEFCWAKFLDPSFSEEHAAMVRDDPSIQTEGYASVGKGTENHDDYYWVCDPCFSDFRARFGWSVVE